MEQKESRRVTMTKLLLKTALIELMQEKPFPQITIKELCERADLNRTTFYLHYADQTAVLREIENEATQKTIEYMKHASPDAGTVELIERFLNYVKDSPMLFRTLLLSGERASFKPDFIASTLSEIRENLPRYGDELHEKYVFIFLMEGSAHIITEWLRSDFDLPTAEIAKTIYALCDSARDLSL
ncbi:MAG: TetR/AcrR family transcriptional regulator C-terminal domain-containing protein [Acutalibacteraceae bacterium]|nr:TetR/AcrR family transcriptional regulator C-terminal domain-containing protein [Acutalibacteraceae bacterium]